MQCRKKLAEISEISKQYVFQDRLTGTLLLQKKSLKTMLWYEVA